MKIEKKSKDFTPRCKGLFFGIDTENSTPSDILVEIIDVATGEIVATQQLREIISAEVNIAPYVRSFAEYSPSRSAHTTFEAVPVASYAIRVNDVVSEPLRVSVNNTPVEPFAIVSTMPAQRYIAYGENDELLLITEPGDSVVANLYADANDSLSVETISQTGAVALSISTKDFGPDTHSITIELMCNREFLEEVNYEFRPSHRKGVRLAWLSGEGSIERYTFPIVVKKELKSVKESIDTNQGRRVVRAVSESLLSICSRYEPSSIIQALTGIVSSPKVWIEEGNEYRAVEVKNSVVESNLFGEPDQVALCIVEWRREEAVL